MADRAKSGCTERLTLGYTIDDDGVWVACNHPNHPARWARNLGFSADVDDVLRAQREHDNTED